MSRNQRFRDNHPLLAAQVSAIEQKVPLCVLFALKTIKSRSREHHEFILTGLEEAAADLKTKNTPFVLRSNKGNSDSAAEITKFAKEVKAGAKS